jgi:hypothetical protein
MAQICPNDKGKWHSSYHKSHIWKENHTDNCHREKKYVQNGGVRTVRGG